MKKNNSIQGLRGLCVAMVICSHLQRGYFEYGFIGVDIFFTISGFVITNSFIHRSQTIGDFYLARFKRLFPALSVIVCFSLIAGICILPSYLFDDLKWSSLYALLGTENLYLMNKGGYFDPSSYLRPLIHTCPYRRRAVLFYLPNIYCIFIDRRENI